MNYMSLCEFLEDNKEGFSIEGKKYIDNIFQRIYQIYSYKRRTALLITERIFEENVHSADMYGGILIEIDFDTPSLRKINVKMDKKTKIYKPHKNSRVSGFVEERGIYGNKAVLNALVSKFNGIVNYEIFRLLDIDISRLVTINTLRWCIPRCSNNVLNDELFDNTMENGEDLTSYIMRIDSIDVLIDIIRYCFKKDRQSSRDMFNIMYKGFLLNDKKGSLEFESSIKIELSKVKKVRKSKEESTEENNFILPINHEFKPDEVNLISNSIENLSEYTKMETLIDIKTSLYSDSEFFIFVRMWKLIENTSERNKKRFGKFIESCFIHYSTHSSNTKKLIKFINILKGSSKKMEEFLDYLYDNKHLFKNTVGSLKYYKYTVIEYIDYYIHVHNLRSNGINQPYYPENLIKSMDDAFALKIKKQYANEESFDKLNLFYESNDKVKRIFKKYPTVSSKNIKGTNYIIKLPMSNNDFVVEGATLKHCASIYYDLVRDEKTLVLFMRHKDNPDTPLYTIEVNVNDNKLVQVSGEYNMDLNPYSDEEACKALVKFCNTHKLDFSNLKYFDKFLDKK